MKRLFIIKVGTTYASAVQRLGDFDEWVQKGLGAVKLPVEVVDILKGERLPPAGECSGVVVTGSHAMVTDNLPWSLGIEEWIPGLLDAGVPFLGICYGHQLLGRAMGGEVGFHPLGLEIGTVQVELTSEGERDRLFTGTGKHFLAHATHRQTVLKLPPGAVHLAGNPHDRHHAFRLGTSAWGVQFHPEYTSEVMDAYILEHSSRLVRKGMDPLPVLRKGQQTPLAALTLRNFALLAEQFV